MPKTIQYRGDHITLGQFLKLVDAIGAGGEVRAYLSECPANVNGEVEQRRGRKLRQGDKVVLADGSEYELASGD